MSFGTSTTNCCDPMVCEMTVCHQANTLLFNKFQVQVSNCPTLLWHLYLVIGVKVFIAVLSLSLQYRQRTKTMSHHKGSPQVWACLRPKRMIPGAQHTYRPTCATIMLCYQLLYANICPSSSIDYISRRVQELVEKINSSRTNDQEVMDNFQEKLTEKVRNLNTLVHSSVFIAFRVGLNVLGTYPDSSHTATSFPRW